MNCKKHKTYRGVRKPTTGCIRCHIIYGLQRALRALKLPHAKVRRAPKSEAKRVAEFVKEFCPETKELLFIGGPHHGEIRTVPIEGQRDIIWSHDGKSIYRRRHVEIAPETIARVYINDGITREAAEIYTKTRLPIPLYSRHLFLGGPRHGEFHSVQHTLGELPMSMAGDAGPYFSYKIINEPDTPDCMVYLFGPWREEYRQIVIDKLTPAKNGGITCDVEAGPCACGAWHAGEVRRA